MRLLLALTLAASLGARPPQAEECVTCHGTIDLTVFRTKAHGGVACVQCHTSIKRLPHEDKPARPRCEGCHRTEAQNFALSVHGVARAKGVEHLPVCSTCHGPAHHIVTRTDPASRVARQNMAVTCGACHPPAFLDRIATHVPRRRSRMDLRKEDLN
jgi:hypothetical protein